MKRILSGLSLSALLCVGCGSGTDSSGLSATGGTGGAASSSGTFLQTGSTSSRLLQDLQGLAAQVAEQGPRAKFLARATSDRAVNGTIQGPNGGTATLVGDFNVGPDSNNPASSTITISFNQFQFADGLILNGGTVRFTSSLYGSETAAHGSTTVDAQGVNFSGTGSGTHNFKIEDLIVNSLPIKTSLTLDGVKRDFGFLVKISNYSSTPDDQVFITLVGKDGGKPEPTYWNYLAHADDPAMTEFEDTPGTFLKKNNDGSFEGSEKYSFPLSDLTPVGDHVREMAVPQENLISGRLFITFGRKLKGIGINSPYYNSAGQPISSGTSGTGTVTAGQAKVTMTSINTSGLAINEPVTFSLNSGTYTGKIKTILNSTDIELDPSPSQTGSTTLTFTPDPALLSSAKLSLNFPSATGGPDYLTTFDFVELSATVGGTTPFYTLFTNTTAIDFFSVGLGMTARFAGQAPVAGQGGLPPSERTVGFGTSAAAIKAGITPRQAIFDRFNNKDNNGLTVPAEFQNFVTSQSSSQNTLDPHITIGRPTDPQADIIRVLGPPPIIALQPTGNLSKFLDGIIDETWSSFCSNAINLTGLNAINYPLANPAFVFEGDTPNSAATLNLKCTTASGTNSGQGDKYQLPKPTTRVVFECDDPLATGADPNNYRNNYSDAHKRLCSMILAAMQRGVFASVPDWHDTSKFYTDSQKRYNFFSRVMHEFSLSGIVYGFAYDDVFGQDSTIAGPINLNVNNAVPESDNGNVVDLTLTIPNFQAAALPSPVTLKVDLDARAQATSPQGCIAHFTTLDGASDKVAILDANGSATFGDLSPNTKYTAWVSPAGPNAAAFFYSYAVNGKYNGTLNGWNSSSGSATPGLVRLKMGGLVPGTGSSLNPQPNSPRAGGLPPEPVSGSGQVDWGN